MIVIVDYGVGNLQSVSNMLRKAGATAIVSGDHEVIAQADKILLPGVGHFDHGMKMLERAGLRGVLDEFALGAKRPVLGICLGAQILGLGSEEGEAQGLGWIDMTCKRIAASPPIRVPHMRWNRVEHQRECQLFLPYQPDARYYFVHSYHMECADQADVVATTAHGIEFASAVQRENVFGVQFHPEKSLRHGLAFLKAFAAL